MLQYPETQVFSSSVTFYSIAEEKNRSRGKAPDVVPPLGRDERSYRAGVTEQRCAQHVSDREHGHTQSRPGQREPAIGRNLRQ